MGNISVNARSILILNLIFFSCSCGLFEKAKPKMTISDSGKTDKIDQERNPGGGAMAGIRYVTSLLGIPQIEDSNTAEEIRIWFDYAISDSFRLVTIKHEANSWSSNFFNGKYLLNDSFDVVGVQKKCISSNPKSGWQQFLRTIEDKGLFQLKSSDQIPEYKRCADGDQISVEIWKNQCLNLYEYPCYGDYDHNIDDVINLKAICELIKNEFDYPIFPRPPINRLEK